MALSGRLVIDLEDEGAQVSDADAVVVRRDRNRVELRFDPTVVSAPRLISQITAVHAVRDLFVEGRQVVRDGRVTTIDLAAQVARQNELAKGLAE